MFWRSSSSNGFRCDMLPAVNDVYPAHLTENPQLYRAEAESCNEDAKFNTALAAQQNELRHHVKHYSAHGIRK